MTTAPAFTVEFDKDGQIIRAFSAGLEGVKKGLGGEALAQPGMITSDKLGNHKVKDITSVVILTTENPHAFIYQAGKLIVLPH